MNNIHCNSSTIIDVTLRIIHSRCLLAMNYLQRHWHLCPRWGPKEKNIQPLKSISGGTWPGSGYSQMHLQFSPLRICWGHTIQHTGYSIAVIGRSTEHGTILVCPTNSRWHLQSDRMRPGSRTSWSKMAPSPNVLLKTDTERQLKSCSPCHYPWSRWHSTAGG